MDKGTLIYIILGILYMLFTASKKKKKNTAPGQPAPQEEAPTNPQMSLEEMIRALRGDAKPTAEPVREIAEEPEVQVVHQHEKMKAEREARRLKSENKYKDIKADVLIQNDRKALDPNDYDDGITFHFAGEDTDEGEFEFDARKAIIYSAIMKRPEHYS